MELFRSLFNNSSHFKGTGESNRDVALDAFNRQINIQQVVSILQTDPCVMRKYGKLLAALDLEQDKEYFKDVVERKPKEFVKQCLESWVSENGKKATIRRLVQLLNKAKYVSIAEKLMERYGNFNDHTEFSESESEDMDIDKPAHATVTTTHKLDKVIEHHATGDIQDPTTQSKNLDTYNGDKGENLTNDNNEKNFVVVKDLLEIP